MLGKRAGNGAARQSALEGYREPRRGRLPGLPDREVLWMKPAVGGFSNLFHSTSWFQGTASPCSLETP